MAEKNGASRQAQDDEPNTFEQLRERLERLGIAIGVREYTPASQGHGIRITVDTGSVMIDPQDAMYLAALLQQDAANSLHADRAGRR